jgi:hypothetical protein
MLIFCLTSCLAFGSAKELTPSRKELDKVIPSISALLPKLKQYEEFFKIEKLLQLPNQPMNQVELRDCVLAASKYPNLPNNSRLSNVLAQVIFRQSLPCLNK